MEMNGQLFRGLLQLVALRAGEKDTTGAQEVIQECMSRWHALVRCASQPLAEDEHALPNTEYDNGSIDPAIDTRMDKLPPLALLAAGAALEGGMKYEKDKPDNWRGVPAKMHLNHALRHVFKFQHGDRSEDHVGHAVSRMLMWAELVLYDE